MQPIPRYTLLACFLWVGIFPALALGQVAADPVRGLVQPEQQVLLNVEIAGKIKQIKAEEGNQVLRGQLLVALEDSVQQHAVEAAQLRAESTAAIREAELQKAEAEVQLDQIISAYEKQAASQWEVRRAALQVKLAIVMLETAKQEHELAKAMLKLEQARLDQHRITAPFDGTIVRIQGELGQTLGPDTPVLMLIDPTQLEAVVHVPVEWYGRLEVGTEYPLHAEAPVGRDLNAKLQYIEPMIDPAARSFRCVFLIDNTDRALPAGFAVQISEP